MVRRAATEPREHYLVRAAAHANLLVTAIVSFLVLIAGFYLRGPGLNATTLSVAAGMTVVAVGVTWFFRCLAR